MASSSRSKPTVMVDADVLLAAAASSSEYGASLLILRLAELTLIEALAIQQVIVEAERNLERKMSAAIPSFRLLAARSLNTLPNPALQVVRQHHGLAQVEDLPILVAAIQVGCPWLVTFNVRHYQPGVSTVTILRPGDFILRVRDRLAHLTG